jgi:hypothetical protein
MTKVIIDFYPRDDPDFTACALVAIHELGASANAVGAVNLRIRERYPAALIEREEGAAAVIWQAHRDMDAYRARFDE